MLTSTHTLKATITGIVLAIGMYPVPSAHAQSAGIGVPPGGSSGSPDLVITGAYLVPIASPSASGASGSSGGSGGSVGGVIATQSTPTTQLEVRVLNRGNGPAGATYLRFRRSPVPLKWPTPATQFGIGSTSPGRLPVMGGPVLLHVLTPALAPGMAAFVMVPSGFNVGFFDLYADALGQLQESNELNNAWKVYLP